MKLYTVVQLDIKYFVLFQKQIQNGNTTYRKHCPLPVSPKGPSNDCNKRNSDRPLVRKDSGGQERRNLNARSETVSLGRKDSQAERSRLGRKDSESEKTNQKLVRKDSNCSKYS